MSSVMPLAIKVLFILFLTVCSQPLLAESEQPISFENADSFYLGLKLGGIRYQHGCQPWALDCDKRDQAAGFYLGYHLNEHFAVEANYADLGEVNASYTEYGIVNNYSASMSGFDFGVLAQYPLTSKLSVFAKGGAFKWQGENRGPYTAVKADDWSQTISAGIRYQFNQHWRARFSYQLIDDLGNDNIGSSNGHIAWLGISYQFGEPKSQQTVASAAPIPSRQPQVKAPPPAASVQPKVLILPALTAQVRFDFDEINFQASARLLNLIEHLNTYRQASVDLVGHADSTGSAIYNLSLSEKRTQQVAQYLLDQGVLAEQINQQFLGDQKPVVDNRTIAHRQQNRRVTLTVNAIKVDVK